MLRNIIKQPRFIAAVFTLIYLIIGLVVFSISLRTAVIVFSTFTVVLFLEPWTRLAQKYFKIKRSLSLGFGLVIIFVGLITLIVFLTTPLAKEASKFYNIVVDFFPSVEETKITSFEVNTNIDRLLSDENFATGLTQEEKGSLEFLSKDLKSYYAEIMKTVPTMETPFEKELKSIEESLREKGNYIVIMSSDQTREASYEELNDVTSRYLSPSNAAMLSQELLANAMQVQSQELWREVVAYFMPKNLDPARQAATYESVRNFLIQVQNILREFLPSLLEKVPSFITSTGLVIFFTIVGAIYLSYYFLSIKEIVPKLYPKKVRKIATEFLSDTYKNLERYVISIVLVAIIVGIVVGIAIKAMGLKYSLLMGLWAAFTNLIPIVGVPLEFIPLLLLAVSTQNIVLVLILLIVLTIVHAAAFILFLVFMKGYNRINPVMIILMIVVAGQLFGLFGVIIAVPFAILIKMLWIHFVSPLLDEE